MNPGGPATTRAAGPPGWHPPEITASSLAIYDDDGEVLEGDSNVESSAFCIPSRIWVNMPSTARAVVPRTHIP